MRDVTVRSISRDHGLKSVPDVVVDTRWLQNKSRFFVSCSEAEQREVDYSSAHERPSSLWQILQAEWQQFAPVAFICDMGKRFWLADTARPHFFFKHILIE